MTKPTNPKIPEGLLERCFSTIPEFATYRPSLSPDAGSRVRLRWLSVAAAVPVLTLAIILPTYKWWKYTHSAQTFSEQHTTPDPNQKIPYMRIQSRSQSFGEGLSNAPNYLLTIHDSKKGFVQWETDDSFSKISPTSRFANLRLWDGRKYISYYRMGKICKVRRWILTKRVRSLQDIGLKDFANADNFRNGKLVKTEDRLVRGNSVRRFYYEEGGGVEGNLSQSRSEVDVDMRTGRVIHAQKSSVYQHGWVVGPKDDKDPGNKKRLLQRKYPIETNTKQECWYYYEPRAQDGFFWNEKRAAGDAKVLIEKQPKYMFDR